jgi:hypothetical protein
MNPYTYLRERYEDWRVARTVLRHAPRALAAYKHGDTPGYTRHMTVLSAHQHHGMYLTCVLWFQMVKNTAPHPPGCDGVWGMRVGLGDDDGVTPVDNPDTLHDPDEVALIGAARLFVAVLNDDQPTAAAIYANAAGSRDTHARFVDACARLALRFLDQADAHPVT